MLSYSVALLFLFLLLLEVTTSGVAAQDLSSTTCMGVCQSLVVNSSAWEATQHGSNDYAFYDVPSNFSKDLAPGKLLRVEYFTNLTTYTVPSGLSMSRIMYTTSDLNGTTLPASAYVLWPYAPLSAPKLKGNQFPMVAWAHGTSGFVKACAPSSYRYLQDHFMVPFRLALEGVAVVAPDYAGLGVSSLPSGEHIGHPYLLGPAVAADLANAVIAARAAFPSQLLPDGPFVGMGHSQGGAAIWAFAERLVDKPLAGYKGTVIMAPAVGYFRLLAKQLTDLTNIFNPNLLGLQAAVIAGVTAAFPAYNDSGLTALGYDRFRNVVEALNGCIPTYTLATSTEDVLFNTTKPDWLSHPTVQRYANLSETGRKKLKGPVLLLAGGLDSPIDLPNFQSTFNDTCAMNKQEKWGESLEMITYQGMNHFPMIQASSSKWLSWIKERLSGKTVAGAGCVHSVVEGYRIEFTVQGIAPNFLVGNVPIAEAWKASF
ncbi:uncharacterized protein A1O9_10547 [Exophiala aquamarina CBS 119918]|uniref:AB hydrolase-1 domain-containing protein n=1 Tax=Exophiala aquamarina CBS 119918 TaxID=1182545 RepID=A0A072P1L1_9EURO|nr:uncharacterized protein A1O9_10547 [Exophiala aquamarina CBS 119918]KEF53572.1 hypothetical protein A1O9_10547 [Exophiala aquamarina CBS 119918]